VEALVIGTLAAATNERPRTVPDDWARRRHDRVGVFVRMKRCTEVEDDRMLGGIGAVGQAARLSERSDEES
jgi:AMMECR1 domain-containing protein